MFDTKLHYMTFLLLLIVCSLASAENNPMVKYTYWSPPENVYPWDQTSHPACSDEKRKRKPVFCKKEPDWPDFETAQERVIDLFAKKNFELLQRAENELAYNTQRFASGEYMFEAWYEAMEYFNVPLERSESRAALSKDWIAAQGGKGFSILSKAEGEYAGATLEFNYLLPKRNSPGKLVKYLKGLTAANTILDEAPAKIKKTALWYELKLRIAYQLPKMKLNAFELLEKAAKAWPDYPPIYGIAYAYSNPHFGGSVKEMEKVKTLALKNAKKTIGAAIYPLMLETAKKIIGFRIDYNALDNSLMKQGFQDYKNLLGGNYQTYFWFAQHACAMKDRESAKMLYEMHDKLKTRNYRGDQECRNFVASEKKSIENKQPPIVRKPSI